MGIQKRGRQTEIALSDVSLSRFKESIWDWMTLTCQLGEENRNML